MPEPRFPFTSPTSVHDRFEAELKARVEAAKAGRNRETVEAKWVEMQMTPEERQYKKRWEGIQLKKGISSIPLTPEQTQDVLARLGLDRLPKDGDYLLTCGAKFKVGNNGATCVLAGYHQMGGDLAEVLYRIRHKQSIRSGEGR